MVYKANMDDRLVLWNTKSTVHINWLQLWYTILYIINNNNGH